MFIRRMKFTFWKARFWVEWIRSYFLSFLVWGRTREEAPFFIVGCGRSGNTVLRRVICESYDVAIPPENPFVYKMIRNMVFSPQGKRARNGLGYLERKLSEPRSRLLPDGTNYVIDKHKEFSIDFQSIVSNLIAKNECNIGTIFSSLYEENASVQGRKRWGDKTPVMIFNYHLVKKMFPQAKFIFMVRDPLDCVSSYRKRMGVSVEKTAARWLMASRMEENIRSKYPDSIITVRYEDLVSGQGQEIDKVAGFLGLSALASGAVDYRYGDDLLLHHEKSKGPLDSSAVGVGLSLLNDRDVNFVSAVLKRRSLMYGYKI